MNESRHDVSDTSPAGPYPEQQKRDGWGPDPLRAAQRPRAPKANSTAPAPEAPRHPGPTGQRLVLIHDDLRRQIRQLRDVVARVTDGQADPATARATINDLPMRQNYRTLGSFCASYCHILTVHHTIEDRALFPQLAQAQQSLEPVVGQLEDEHETIATVLTALDRALVDLMSGDDAADNPLAAVRAHVEALDEMLHSHLDYEEEELVEPLTRLGIDV